VQDKLPFDTVGVVRSSLITLTLRVVDNDGTLLVTMGGIHRQLALTVGDTRLPTQRGVIAAYC